MVGMTAVRARQRFDRDAFLMREAIRANKLSRDPARIAVDLIQLYCEAESGRSGIGIRREGRGDIQPLAAGSRLAYRFVGGEDLHGVCRSERNRPALDVQRAIEVKGCTLDIHDSIGAEIARHRTRRSGVDHHLIACCRVDFNLEDLGDFPPLVCFGNNLKLEFFGAAIAGARQVELKAALTAWRSIRHDGRSSAFRLAKCRATCNPVIGLKPDLLDRFCADGPAANHDIETAMHVSG